MQHTKQKYGFQENQWHHSWSDVENIEHLHLRKLKEHSIYTCNIKINVSKRNLIHTLIFQRPVNHSISPS